jgi:glycosyltransferase involved in cell wall biosynthesis
MSSVGDSGLVANGGLAPLAALGRRLAQAAFDVPTYARRLDAAIRDFAPDVVHSNGIKTHLLASLRWKNEPLVWHVRDFIGERPLVSKAMRAVALRADVAVAISEAVADDVRSIFPRLAVSIVHDAIDTDLFAPEGRATTLDALAGCDPSPPDTVRVGLVATYARWKGHDVFLKAASLLGNPEGRRGVLYYVIGGPIYATAASQYREDELRTLARDLGVGDQVRFVPFQEQVQEVYRALDVVVHASSRREPFGRTIAEAMASGKPVIASRESGASELFVDGVDALSTPGRDPAALAEAIRALVTDPDRRRALGVSARRTAVKRFSRGRLATQLFSVYRDVGPLRAAP